MADEPISEQIAVKLKETLAAIVSDDGDTYWYTPGVVLRVDYFEDAPPNTAYDVVYLLRPADRQNEKVATRGTINRRGEWWVSAAAKDLRPTKEPYLQDEAVPFRETVKSRLLNDIHRAFSGAQPWTSWAGLNVYSVTVTDEDMGGSETEWELWCMVHARILVEWRERFV